METKIIMRLNCRTCSAQFENIEDDPTGHVDNFIDSAVDQAEREGWKLNPDKGWFCPACEMVK